MNRTPLLCIAGGGTGGHVMPALALADAARAQWPNMSVTFIGAERGLEARLLPERGEEVLLLSMHGVKGAGIAQRLRVMCWELPQSIRKIRASWRTRRPDVVVGVGGYASASGVAAALLSRIPVVLYEQNAMPGMVNRLLGRFCQRVMLGFDAARIRLGHAHTVVTGNMVREQIARTQWHTHQPPRLLVTGGSQGARFLNETVPEACRLLAERGHAFVVTHIVGKEPAALEKATAIYAAAGIAAETSSFCDDMAGFFASGDLLIARSGAMTVSEAAMCGMPALYVPLPHAADDHQRHNAEALAVAGGAAVLSQNATSAEMMADRIEQLLFSPDRLQAMSLASLAVAPRQAKDKQLGVLAEFLSFPGGCA